LDRRLGGSQSRSAHGGEEKNSQFLPGQETPIIRPVARSYTTELHRLLFISTTGGTIEAYFKGLPTMRNNIMAGDSDHRCRRCPKFRLLGEGSEAQSEKLKLG